MPARLNLILLIEDSEDDVFFFKRAMEQAKLSNPVQVVHDVGQAIGYLEGAGPFADRSQFPLPKIIFVDLHMPSKDGFEFLKWLGDKREFRTLHVVAISGIGRMQEINRAYQIGANSFVTKPIKPEDLQNLARGFSAYWT
jgi:CheY-like chemotaxis protein